MLEKFYKDNDIPFKEQIPLAKGLLLVVPDKDYDIKPVLARFDVSRYEVAVTWPKPAVDMFAEICAVGAETVLQVGQKFFKKFLFVENAAAISDELVASVTAALPDAFVNFHHHDEYSIKDGLGTVHDLVNLLKAQKRSYCCVSNHGSVGGWIKQYNACKKAGIKAIFACELYTSNYRGDDPEEKKKHRSANHLLLIARTMEGFENIIKIHNDAQMDGFYYTPRANREAFERWGKGVIASSACLGGEIPQLLAAGEKEKALEAYQFYSRVFDRFYIEIQMIEYGQQQEANKLLIQFAKEVGAPMMASLDSHYLEPEHDETHSLLLCIRQHKTLLDAEGDENVDVWSFDVRNLYYRSLSQIQEIYENGFVENGEQRPPFRDDVFTDDVFAEAIWNTHALAMETEDIKLDSTVKLPKLYDNSEDILRSKVNEGFVQRGLDKLENYQDYIDRLQHEFNVITKLGWTDYFLIVEDMIAYAIKQFGEYAVGYGRGSVGGSLVAYVLNISDVDPIKYGLLFERFLDESRPTPPDIDCDFDPNIREDIKKYLVQKFGEEHVCSIGTYQTYKTRAVILDVARALGQDVNEANEVTKVIEPLKAFEDEEGEETKVDDLEFDEVCNHYPELKAYFDRFPEVRHHAEILRNQVKNMGTHAGGVIISDIDLRGRIPVLYDKVGSEDRKVISAWAESGNTEELSSVGLVKYDILGLNNLPIVSECIALIEKNRGEKIRRRDIPIDDRRTIHLASKKDLVGIFQLDNPSTKSIVDAVEVESLLDIAVVTSLIRPGPRDMGMDMEYAKRKHGEAYEAPEILKELLADTYGIVVFQEQAMRIAQVVGGLSKPESYKFLKAIAKKKQDLMASFKDKFSKGAQPLIDAGKLTILDVETIWATLEKFCRYAFNLAHSVEYSALSTTELWLKLNYPTEYMCALINNTKLGKKKHGQDIFTEYISYARRSGIDVLPPNISKSKTSFVIDNGKILFSIGHVKSVASMASVIESFQPFADMADFYERAKIDTTSQKTGKTTSRRPNKKVVESLIEAGAFDTFGMDRNALMAEYYRLRNIKKETPPQYTEKQWLEREIEATGMCLSVPPLCRQYDKQIEDNKLKLISGITGKKVRVFGMIEEIKAHTSKTGNPMYIVRITDGYDKLSFFVFKAGQTLFKDKYKHAGTIGGFPLDKFEDGDTRFFNDRGEIAVFLKPPAPQQKVAQKDAAQA